MTITTRPSIARIAPLLTAGLLLTACLDAESDSIEPLELDAEPETAEGLPGGADSIAAEVGTRAALQGFQVDITAVGSEVLLSWAGQGVTDYEVWRSRNPYFVPSVPCEDADEIGEIDLDNTQCLATLVDPASLDYTDDLGAISAFTPDFYYVVRTVEAQPALSTTVGRHQLSFFATESSGYNMVPMSLEPTYDDPNSNVPPPVFTAADVFGAMAPDALNVFQINSVSEPDSFLQWNPGIGFAPFQVTYGSVPIMQMTPGMAPAQRAIVGYVPEPTLLDVTLYPGRNDVVLPLHFPDVLASELFQVIPGVSRVGRFDAGTQQEVWVDSANPEVDMLIPSGGDLHIDMNELGAWPIDVADLPAECCEAHSTPGCEDPGVEACVCAQDAFCCNNQWDSLCVDQANNDCNAGCGGEPPPPPPPQGDCCTETPGTPGCTDGAIEACVCGLDAFCCNTAWDGLCVSQAANDCGAGCS